MKSVSFKGAALAAVLTAAPVFGITITPGNQGGGNVNNVLFNEAGLLSAGTTVQGTLNSNPGTKIDFTSTSNLTTPSAGQARVEGPLSNLTISLDGGGTFDLAVLNPVLPPGSGNASGVIQFTINGTSFAPFAIGNGNNFFTIEAGAGEDISSISFTSSLILGDVRQIRLGGLSIPTATPDGGSTFALAGIALLAVGTLRSRFSK